MTSYMLLSYASFARSGGGIDIKIAPNIRVNVPFLNDVTTGCGTVTCRFKFGAKCLEMVRERWD